MVLSGLFFKQSASYAIVAYGDKLDDGEYELFSIIKFPFYSILLQLYIIGTKDPNLINPEYEICNPTVARYFLVKNIFQCLVIRYSRVSSAL